MKFMRHGKRTKLTVDDINNALRVRNVEVHEGAKSRRLDTSQRMHAVETIF